MTVWVKVKKLHPDARMPTFAKDGDACADLYAVEDFVAYGYAVPTTVLKTGIALEVPPGYEAQIRGRSGLTSKGVHVHLGTVDSGYRGEVGVMVTVHQSATANIRKGDRIAQIAVRPVPEARFIEADELGDSERGATGFGSSGR